ncbi:MAG: pentapeptide repeat-containing protein [Microcoleus sp. PH2017_22_RUC_O_B]|nr:pentapeptide repeat-containing protein [Microcoleus sp. PH2017_21_RUC_O_A]MCC3544823.1 pentapeptide repeat-containing protein [Microcoleus sp. PH2017_22_RUC_O_B]
MEEAISSFCPPKERCNFSKVNWNRGGLQRCMFIDCDFIKINFTKAKILEVTFVRCNLTDAKRVGLLAPESYMKDSIHPNGQRVSHCSL